MLRLETAPASPSHPQEIVDDLDESRRENENLLERLTRYESNDDDDESESDEADNKDRKTGSQPGIDATTREALIEEGLEEIADAKPKAQLEWLLAERRQWTKKLEEELKGGGGRGGTSLLTIPTEPFGMRHSASTGKT